MAIERSARLRPLVLDASAAINLVATQQPWAILTALGFRALVAWQVLGEVVRCPVTRKRYDAAKHPFRISPNVEIVTLSAVETEHFIDIAQSVGDGEAASIALALSRGMPLVLDDRRARAVALERDQSVRLIWTTELLRHEALAGVFSRDDIDAFFATALRFARMYVPKQK
jgi:predicted nucleic acid-binding protein